MQLDRPMLDTWRATPWVAGTPVDDRTVGGILREEVQVEFRGTGRMSERELVPLTPAAHQLLNGPHGERARSVLRGVLATLDGHEAAAELRGMSMSSDPASFATNLLLSNTEAGFFQDRVAADDPAGFEQDMVALIPSVKVAKAQNTGWMDLGPRVSQQLRGVVELGAAAPSADATEVALTVLHELQHSISPHDPNTVEPRHVWLEEGIAETLAWWPGRAQSLRERMGVPVRAGEAIDPWSVPPDSVASTDYRNRHRVVQELLGLAGIVPLGEDGRPIPGAFEQAHQLLQADSVQAVPRDLARAIVRHHRLDPAAVESIAPLIADIDGDPAAVGALADAVGIRR